jgi:hypothetical protein
LPLVGNTRYRLARPPIEFPRTGQFPNCREIPVFHAHVLYGTDVSRPWVQSRLLRFRVWKIGSRRTTSCNAHIDTSVCYSWLLSFCRQRRLWPTPEIKTAAVTTTTTSGTTIGTTVTTIAGMTAKTALTAATWWHNTGATVSSTGRATGSTGITGIGATVIQITING